MLQQAILAIDNYLDWVAHHNMPYWLLIVVWAGSAPPKSNMQAVSASTMIDTHALLRGFLARHP